MVAESNVNLDRDADCCLIGDGDLLGLSNPDAGGFLERRSNISGWYRYWFSLSGSQLLYFERGQSARRGLLVGTISLFRHKLTIVNSLKRRREIEIADSLGKAHVLRAESDAEMHWWIQLFNDARNKIPPARPIELSQQVSHSPDGKSVSLDELQRASVGSHLKVDHVLCVVHGIGVSADVLTTNTRSLRESYLEIMAKVFPDVEFRVEILVIHWRKALTDLEVHRKLQAVVPVAPVDDDANPLRQFMVHRIVDYVYYTHDRYRRHILREVASQLNSQVESFRLRRPDFDGEISVMAHSLGSAICYDLMCRKVCDDQVLLESEGMRLNFDAANLFCLGNPLGTLLGLDRTIGLGADMRTLPFRIFNVFKYHDPLATRLEPVIDLGAVDVRPVTVPCWFNMGLRESTAQWLGTLWQGGKKRGSRSDETKDGGAAASEKCVDAAPERAANSGEESAVGAEATSRPSGVAVGWEAGSSQDMGTSVMDSVVDDGTARQKRSSVMSESNVRTAVWRGVEFDRRRSWSSGDLGAANGCAAREPVATRIDFALQASSTMEDVSTHWSALKAHTEYWGNRDAMLLMVSAMMKSTFGLSGVEDAALKEEMERRIVDKNILEKAACWGGKDGAGSWGAVGQESGTAAAGDVALGPVVAQIVERLVNEAVAMQELLTLHPQVKMRSGGVTTRSPVGSAAEIRRPDASEGASGRGWASYLGRGWFGAESKATGGAAATKGSAAAP